MVLMFPDNKVGQSESSVWCQVLDIGVRQRKSLCEISEVGFVWRALFSLASRQWCF